MITETVIGIDKLVTLLKSKEQFQRNTEDTL